MKKNSIITLTAIVAFATVSHDALAQYRSRPSQSTSRRTTTTTTTTTYTRSSSSSSLLDVGYKGFLEVGFAGGVSDHKANQLDILTTHGISAGNFFLGLGLGVNILFPQDQTLKSDMISSGYWEYASDYDYYNCTDNAVLIPIYLDFKYNFGNTSNICPFIDMKIGASFLVSDQDGAYIGEGWMDKDACFYFSPTIGFRVPLSNSRTALNIGLTYNLLSQKYRYFDDWSGREYYNDGIVLHSLGARVSIEW